MDDKGKKIIFGEGNSSANYDADMKREIIAGRIQGIELSKAIVFGNCAWLIDRGNVDGPTHRFKVFIKPYDNENMSVYVKRVEFQRHGESLNPYHLRCCVFPPYEIMDFGNDEFIINIQIFFQDGKEKPVTVKHHLKLFGTEAKSYHEVEFYDELVFRNPTVKMYHLLSRPKVKDPGATFLGIDWEDKKRKDLKKILEAKKKVKDEIAELKERLKDAQQNILKYKMQVAASGGDGSKNLPRDGAKQAKAKDIPKK